uniref:Uncharacterized protein n=1 Tax=Arundo donax TaxID=35708 RepID=A0A0A9CDV9_ARUDO
MKSIELFILRLRGMHRWDNFQTMNGLMFWDAKPSASANFVSIKTPIHNIIKNPKSKDYVQ